jgi:hypothetical protein
MPERSAAVATRTPVNFDAVAQEIDATAADAIELFKTADNTSRSLRLAQSMANLRRLLSAEVMAPIMDLMNTEIGFLTDRDPKRARPGERPPDPYSVDVVRDCFIESLLRGFRPVGNEWNIIAGRFYGAQEGFRRRLTDGVTFPKIANLKLNFGIPKLAGEKGAVVAAEAEWDNDGSHDSIKTEFAVRVNAGMGADAIIGKTERKLLKRVHDRVQGRTTPGVDDSESPTIDVQAAPVRKPAFADASTPAASPPKTGVEPPKPAEPVVQAGTARAALASFLTQHGISFTALQEFVVREALDPTQSWDSFASVDEVPEKSAAYLLRAQAGILRNLKSEPVTA